MISSGWREKYTNDGDKRNDLPLRADARGAGVLFSGYVHVGHEVVAAVDRHQRRQLQEAHQRHGQPAHHRFHALQERQTTLRTQ